MLLNIIFCCLEIQVCDFRYFVIFVRFRYSLFMETSLTAGKSSEVLTQVRGLNERKNYNSSPPPSLFFSRLRIKRKICKEF